MAIDFHSYEPALGHGMRRWFEGASWILIRRLNAALAFTESQCVNSTREIGSCPARRETTDDAGPDDRDRPCVR